MLSTGRMIGAVLMTVGGLTGIVVFIGLGARLGLELLANIFGLNLLFGVIALIPTVKSLRDASYQFPRQAWFLGIIPALAGGFLLLLSLLGCGMVQPINLGCLTMGSGIWFLPAFIGSVLFTLMARLSSRNESIEEKTEN